ISFGLPARELINSAFYTMALQNGLSCAIINPNNQPMMQAYRSFCALMNQDENFASFIEAYQNYKSPEKRIAEAMALSAASAGGAGTAGATSGTSGTGSTPSGQAAANGSSGAASGSSDSAKNTASAGGSSRLMEAIRRGMAAPAAEATREALKKRDALDIINEDLVPALDIVGQGFEKGTVFLPQLLMAADAAKEAFAVVKEAMAGSAQEVRGRIILATVKGDIHDIGKNIVKVLLENYGYDVIDLGKDVDPETIVETAIREDVKLVGLSALMTTTVVNMEETIRLLRERKPDCRIAVGGAVMTRDYSDKIGADCFGRDAMTTVRYADELCEKGLL
ncbi:methylmalonyl-CoA mutase C-terminal domain-containing protein, partial [[Clostridium] aminophilum]